MDIYLDALQALHKLLDHCDVSWRDSVAKSIEDWEKNRSTGYHLSMCGKECLMDVILESRQHKLTEDQEVWFNRVYHYLSVICYFLARGKGAAIPASEMKAHLPLSFSKNSSQNLLSGWRCFSCGYGEVLEMNMDFYLANQWARENILQAYEKGTLVGFVDFVLQDERSDFPPLKEKLKQKIFKSGILIGSDRHGDECPRCGCIDTAAFDWELDPQEVQFIPSLASLPLSWRYPGKRR